MKPKTLAILAAVALVLVGAAALSLKSRAGAHARVESEEVLVPDLAARVNDVTEVKVEKAGQTATLAKEGSGWVCREQAGYAADFDKVRSLLVALARLEVVEPMTKDPASHAKLGVDAASGARVVLRDASGNTAADVVVGEALYARGGQRVYARRADSDQAYLCEGELAPTGDPLTWIPRDILRLDASRPGQIEIAHADGETLRVKKDLPSSPNWEVEDVPPDKSLKTAAIANSLGTALSYLTLDAVKPAAELPLAEHQLATSTFHTFDGLAVDVRVAKIEEESWITLSVRYEEPPAPLGPAPDAGAEAAADSDATAGPEVAGSEAAPGAEAAPADPAAEAVAPEVAAAAKEAEEAAARLRKEAAELEARLQGWAFKIPQYKADLFLRRMSDMVAEPAPPEAPPDELIPAEPPADEPPAGQDPADGGGAADGSAVPSDSADGAPAEDPPADGAGGGTPAPADGSAEKPAPAAPPAEGSGGGGGAGGG